MRLSEESLGSESFNQDVTDQILTKLKKASKSARGDRAALENHSELSADWSRGLTAQSHFGYGWNHFKSKNRVKIKKKPFETIASETTIPIFETLEEISLRLEIERFEEKKLSRIWILKT